MALGSVMATALAAVAVAQQGKTLVIGPAVNVRFSSSHRARTPFDWITTASHLRFIIHAMCIATFFCVGKTTVAATAVSWETTWRCGFKVEGSAVTS